MSNAESYMMFEVVDAADVPAPLFDTVVDYWHAKRGDKFAPAWADMELMDLPLSLLPNCIVVDVDNGGQTISYRYFGTAIADMHGYELTGRNIDHIEPPALRVQVKEQYRLLLARRAPLYFVALFPFLTGRQTHQYLVRLPLSDDGETITNVISFQDIADYGKALTKYYSETTAARR